MYYVYYLYSTKYQKFYVGFTQDLRVRLSEHNAGTGSTFTSKFRPWKLVFYEAHLNELDARKMEKFYKSGYGREVLKKKLENFLRRLEI